MSTAMTPGNGQSLHLSEPHRFSAPLADVFENDDEYVILAELPGVCDDDLTLCMEDGTLTISAKTQPSSDGTALATEMAATEYKRSFRIPQIIDLDRVEAELTHGILRVRLPKSEAVKPRKIQVKVR